jgi:hypothetical protein
MNNILAAGLLRQKCEDAHNRAKEYVITYLDENHLPLVMKLQEVILQDLTRPDLLQSFSYDFMKRHMGPKGAVLGVFVEKRLVAFRNLYFPDPWEAEWNLGLDLGLPEEELAYVANLQMVCVHPSFRGNSLALKMNQVSLGLLREKGAHHHICATVSPYNIWNIPVLLASGFRISKLKNKYGGKIRYIVHQDLRQSLHFSDRSAVQVCLDDLDAQQQLFDAGFYGVALSRRENAAPHNSAREFDLTLKTPVRKQAAPFDLAMPAWWSWPLETDATNAPDAYSTGNEL